MEVAHNSTVKETSSPFGDAFQSVCRPVLLMYMHRPMCACTCTQHTLWLHIVDLLEWQERDTDIYQFTFQEQLLLFMFPKLLKQPEHSTVDEWVKIVLHSDKAISFNNHKKLILVLAGICLQHSRPSKKICHRMGFHFYKTSRR